MRRPLLQIIWASALGFCVAVEAHAGAPLLVGVLENVEPGNLSPGMATQHVRLAFQYRDHKWKAFDDHYPASVDWTVVFDGRRIGAIQSRVSKFPAHWMGDFGIENITTAPGKVPQVHAGAANFSYTGNVSLTRPLVLVSQPHFSDPDVWKPGSLSDAEKKLAIQSFRAKVASLEQCDPTDTSDDASPTEDKPPRLIPYSDDQVLLINIYRSKRSELLVGMRLPSEQSNCDFFDDPNFYDYWFVVNGTSVRFLDSEMTPMDAADLTGSGHSEWIFQTSRGEDEDGYELFYDDFTNKAAFSWQYH
jgi:hypothetical protein